MVTKKLLIQLDDPLLTPQQVADRLQMHKISVQNMRLKGKGPPWIRPNGKRVYYPQRLFEEWLNKTLTVPGQDVA